MYDSNPNATFYSTYTFYLSFKFENEKNSGSMFPKYSLFHSAIELTLSSGLKNYFGKFYVTPDDPHCKAFNSSFSQTLSDVQL